MVQIDLQRHTVIFGRSGSGKTTLARKLIYEPTRIRTIFLNLQGESGFGRPIRKWDPRHLREPGSKMNLVFPRPTAEATNSDEYRTTLNAIVDDLFAIGETHLRDGRRPTLFYVIVDEAHLLAPKNPEPNGLTLVATNGAKYGVRFCAITQRPALLDHTVITQADQRILLDIADTEDPYLRHYRVPDHVLQWIRARESDGLTLKRNIAAQIGPDWHLCHPHALS